MAVVQSPRGKKRKADDMNGCIADGESNGRLQMPTATVLTLPADLMQPLYCKLCSVSLNSPQQAQAHYQGKCHAKKVRQYLQKQGQVLLQVHLQTQQNQENNSDTPSPSPSQEEQNTAPQHQNGVHKPEPPEKEPTSPTTTTNNTSNGVMHTKLASSDDFCKICGVSFNSPTQAQSHYQGKNHAKKQKSLQTPPNKTTVEDPTIPKATKKLICFVCNLTLNSEAQLDSHVKSYKHQQKVLHEQRGSKALQGRWTSSNGANHTTNPALGNGTPTGIRILPQNTHGNHQGMFHGMQPLSPPLAKKPPPRPKDLTMVMTPSGKFYCACCDLMLNSEVQFRQHTQSKKHRARNAGFKKVEL